MNPIKLDETQENVEILVRDINGKKYVYGMPWSEVCSFVAGNDNLLEEEILMIGYNGRIMYSSLGSPAITWDDVTGFFA